MQCPSLTDNNNPTAAAFMSLSPPHYRSLVTPFEQDWIQTSDTEFSHPGATLTVCDQLTTITLQPSSEDCSGNHIGLLAVVLNQPVVVEFALQRSCTGCSLLVYFWLYFKSYDCETEMCLKTCSKYLRIFFVANRISSSLLFILLWLWLHW